MENYPPKLEISQLTALTTEIKDWQITHGSLLKLVYYEENNTVPTRPIGAAIFPTPFPQHCFEEAKRLAPIFNKLYAAVSEDETWLYSILQHLISTDDFIAALWDIHQSVKLEGYAQAKVLGIFRADYMLNSASEKGFTAAQLKQVEVNTFSVAGGTHGNLISDMHRYLLRTGVYDFDTWCEDIAWSLPQNDTVENIVSALAEAHAAYGPVKSKARTKCVLIIVQPFNLNICDERPIEHALWANEIPTYRVSFGDALLATTSLGPNRELLFKPGRPGSRTLEVSVVYWRSGYDAEEYDDLGKQARLLVERSLAIKCPSITCHLATLKLVQQALTSRDNLARFLDPEEVALITPVFMPIYGLDDSDQGLQGRALATSPDSAEDYVLKPSLEGGGHNVYRRNISSFLEKIRKEEWRDYVLMQMIKPPALRNTLISFSEEYCGLVASELGVFGTCMWKRSTSSKEGSGGLEILSNVQAGHSFKTKSASVDEMSVVKGYGCFDSPLLITPKNSKDECS